MYAACINVAQLYWRAEARKLLRYELHILRYVRLASEFEWDDANIDHVAAHEVEPDEVEEAFTDSRRVELPAYSTPTERRRGFVGATFDGRLLFVVFTRRGRAIRVVTARDADPPERRSYRRRNR